MPDLKAIAQRIPNEVMNEGKISVLDEVVAPDSVDHSAPPGLPPGREGFKVLVRALRAAFPDLHYRIIHQVAEGDMVVGHIVGSGTMKGDFMGVPATGKGAEWKEIHIARFKADQMVEHWGLVDQLGMFKQLGLAPAELGALAPQR